MPLDPKTRQAALTLNESPSEKEGKSRQEIFHHRVTGALNESPSEKEGKCSYMLAYRPYPIPLNESPSEKEGKSGSTTATQAFRTHPQ